MLNPYDQQVYDAGFKYIPQSQYLLNPFQIPVAPEASGETVTGGLPAIYQAQSGGGDGQNVLGPDSRGYIGNYQGMDFKDMYKYTPQGIMVEDFSKPFPDFLGRLGERVSYPGNQSGYIKPAPEIFEPQQQNIFQKGLRKVGDFGKMIGGGIMSAATGIPFLGSALEGFAGQFENRPLGAAVIDEFGNVYDEEELNKMNALGGYYTEAARSARRRTNRINAMLQRRAEGKKISEANLAKLQAQEKAQEAARQAAADRMQAENRDRGRGGYQSDFAQDSDFMGGGDRGRGNDPDDAGGSDTMGSFMDGGIVDLVDIYD
jgi:hypothetical protein